MSLFVIADLHLSLGTDKPMDIFRGWQDYVPRLEENWRKLISDEDTVVIPGDVSWAMKLERTEEDFGFINSLPGTKLIMKGNHDLWWTTMNKMNTFCAERNFTTLHFINNDCWFYEDAAVCGTRSWLFDIGEPHDAKMMNREICRLRASLDAAGDREKLVFLHYPPISLTGNADEIIAVLQEYGVKECWYGHLHGPSIPKAVQGIHDGINYQLVSADALRFCPLKIR